MSGSVDIEVHRPRSDPQQVSADHRGGRPNHRPGRRRGSDAALTDRPVSTATRAVPFLLGGASLADALEAFAFAYSRHLVIVDRRGRCLGVLSDRLVVAAWARDPFGLWQCRVADLLVPLVPQVTPDATIGRAAIVMADLGVDALAVVDGGVPVGVVTAADLVDMLAREALRRQFELER